MIVGQVLDDKLHEKIETIPQENYEMRIHGNEPQKGIVNFMDFSNLENALKTVEVLCKARCIPQCFWDNPSDALVVIQCGHEVGLSPITSLQNMMVINGRTSIYGEAMLALCMKTMGKKYGFIDCIETYDDTKGEWTCCVTRDWRSPITRTFTMQEAKDGGFLNKPGPWQTSRKRMMQVRPRSFALRDMFPDILKGILTVEEIRDIEDYNRPEKKQIGVVDSMKERLKNKLNIEENKGEVYD